MKTIKFVRPTTYVDTSIWIVWEHPDSKEIMLFKEPISLNLILEPSNKFEIQMKSQFGESVQLQDLGDWDNCTRPVKHPFKEEHINE